MITADDGIPGDEIEPPPRKRRKGIYILPNLFTLGALFGGFYAVVMGMNGRFEQSAYGVVDKRFFQGLPSPAAAALVMGFICLMDNAGFTGIEEGPWLGWVTFGFTLYAGLTMVTNVPFYSFKDLSIKRSVPFVVIVLIA